MVNQRGILLGIPVGEDLETWIKESRDFDWVTMYKIIFSDKIREDALSALDNMNINHSTLFPDLIGSSLYTNYQLEIEPFLDDERGRLWHTHDPLKKQLTAIAKTAKKTPSD